MTSNLSSKVTAIGAAGGTAAAATRGTKRKRPSQGSRRDGKHASSRRIPVSQQQQAQLAPERTLIARFYPLVLSLPDYVKRATGIDLFTADQPETSQCITEVRSSLSRFVVGISDTTQAHRLGVDGKDPRAAPSRPERREPIRDVVHRAQLSVIRSLSRDSLPTALSRKTNVLTLGYSKPDERIDTFNALAPGQLGLANHYPNTLVTTILTAPEWSYLLDRIGDDAFHQLLSATAVFAPILSPDTDGSCFVQMTGQSLSELPELKSGPSQAAAAIGLAEHEQRASANAPALDPQHGGNGKGSRGEASSTMAQNQGVGKLLKENRVGSLVRVTSAASTALSSSDLDRQASNGVKRRSQAVRSLSQIVFVRSRIFYARPIRSKRGKVELGLPFVHVLNRSANPVELAKALPSSASQPARRAPISYPGDPKPCQTLSAKRCRHVLKYIFPRQYGLHNVFTTPKDHRVTTQPFSDYTTRETEIRSRGSVKTPNRLRPVMKLVAALIKRHDRMDYRRLLDQCCPSRLPRRRLTSADKEQIANDLTEQPLDIPLPSHPLYGDSSLELGPIAAFPLARNLEAKKAKIELPPSSEEVARRIHARTEQKPRFANYAVPSSGQVVHFVTTVVRRLVPRDLFGSQHNLRLVVRNISRFVRARRFETTNLHQVLQGLRTTDVDWTLPPGIRARSQRATPSESAKRRELFGEFLYWLIDSLVIPLLRTTFYATESAAYRNRVLYFRQDDWHTISKPLLDKLKTTIFEPLTRAEALAVMSSRKLGYSHIRLLPKETGVRPIVNLRRRSTRQFQTQSEANGITAVQADVARKRKRESERLGQSINFILQSAFHILTYEKKRHLAEDGLGASVFGPNEIYSQLKRFRAELERMPNQCLGKGAKRRLYFVKVDVKCAFDSIDQDRLVEIVKEILSQKDGYLIHRFAKVMPSSLASASNATASSHNSCSSSSGLSHTRRSYVKLAQPDNATTTFASLATTLASALHHVIFVDSVTYRHEERDRILNLLRQHVMGNLVKISGEFYRQKVGIPQGSSLSTMLCSFFYAHLERTRLGFVREAGSLLLRYTDDFLFITTRKSRAKRFYRAMWEGHEEYGCFIAREKSVVNFDLRQEGPAGVRSGGSGKAGEELVEAPLVARCTGRVFPWCGFGLDTSTLAIEPDLTRYRNIDMADTLTVEASRRPGLAFIEKLVQAVKPRTHILYTDTALNTQPGVYTNLFCTFLIVATKYVAYLDELRRMHIVFRPAFLVGAIKKVVRYTALSVGRRAVAAKKLDRRARCTLLTTCVYWVGYKAFLLVLRSSLLRQDGKGRKGQTDEVVVSVEALMRACTPQRGARRVVESVARKGWEKFRREVGG